MILREKGLKTWECYMVLREGLENLGMLIWY